MFNIVLYQPEIPPNTGNIIRLCANTGATLHLIHPLGFALDDKRLKRAGLDYIEWRDVQNHNSIAACLGNFNTERIFAVSTKGKTIYSDCRYDYGDTIIFGPETRGLPADFLASLPATNILRIPMQPGNRSLNLSNAAAIVLYEALRQNNFQFTGS